MQYLVGLAMFAGVIAVGAWFTLDLPAWQRALIGAIVGGASLPLIVEFVVH